MTVHRQGIWLSGFLMLSLVGCTIFSTPKRPPSPPKAESVTEAPEPPEPTPPVPQAEAAPAPAPPTTKEPPIVRTPQVPPLPPTPKRTATPPTPKTPPTRRNQFVVLNFDQADIEVVIHAASEIVGFNYVLAPGVKGKVTVQTSSRIPQEEVFNVLLAILEVHGFTAVKSGTLYKIIKVEGARQRPVPTIVGAIPDPERVGDEIITQIVPIRFASVADLTNLLRPLMSTRGSLIPHRETNLLLITDAASNVRRLLDIVRLVDVEIALEELQVIPVKFADAQELAGILNQVFASGRVRSTAAPARAAPQRPRGAQPTPAKARTESPAAERPPLIVAYRGINVLIVHARKNEMEVIRHLLSQVDVDIYGGRRIFIYYAENAKAADLATTMNAIYEQADSAVAGGPAPPGAPPSSPYTRARPAVATPSGSGAGGLEEGTLRFIGDEVTNAIIVTTFPRNWPNIEDTLKKLDRMPRQVLIEVLVAEIKLEDNTRLGIEWAIREGSFEFFQAPKGSFQGRPLSQFSIPPVATTGLASVFTAFAFETDKFFTLLNMLDSENKVNILSSPSILTTENKTAVINVSESVPVVTAQQVPTVGTTATAEGAEATAITTQTIEYVDAGVILTVTPRIGERGTVALDIKQEVNDVGPKVEPTGSPSFLKREVETSAVLTNNQTLVLGGLIENKRTIDRVGIPLLSRIPLLGLLFGSTEEKIEKTELLILITPRVIGTALDAAKLTEEMKRITPSIEKAIRRAPRRPSPPPKPPEPSPELVP